MVTREQHFLVHVKTHICVLYIISLGMYAIKHGEPREGNYNFWAGLVATGINVALLKWGGFF